MTQTEQIFAKLDGIEAEVEEIKVMLSTAIKPKKPASLRGMAKLLVSEEELDKGIKKAKLSLLKRPKNVCS